MHELFKKRRSIRKFTEEDVSEEQLEQILCAAMVAPSGKNRRPWEFIVIRDKSTMSKLQGIHQYASFVADAPVLLVIVGDEPRSRYWLHDCSLAAGHVYLEATNQGLGTCWTNVYNMQTREGQDSEEFVREVLDIPADKRVLCLMPIGHPGRERKHYEERLDKSIVHYEAWDDKESEDHAN